jgi:O-antigen/teichoic acid export membrane protein
MPQVEPSPAEPASLDKHLVSSVAWTVAAKWGSQILSWACFVLVARLVPVRDFGLISMGSAFLGVLALLGEFGVSSTVVNLRSLDRDQLRQLNGLSFLLGIMGLAVTVSIAHPMALFFRAPELVWMVPVMGVGLVFTGVRGVPQGLLQRDLRFKLISGIEAAQMCAQAFVTLALARLGGATGR